jgi:DNA helicase-2/ATP-dependent DNA helicase PcrA
VAALAKALIEKEHLQPSKILILLRSDYQGTWSGPIKAELTAAGIEYADPEMVPQVLGRPSNRMLIALLRLMVHQSDSLAWATVLTLTQGIGPVFLDTVYERARNDGSQFGSALLALHADNYPNVAKTVAGRVRERIENILAILAAHPIPEERPEGGWGTWIIELGISEASLSADEDFHEILHQVDGLVDETLGLDRYIGQIAPLAKDLAQSSSTGVRIMSMASSKGLTAEATILPGLEAGVMPRPDQDREEERRLLYVAVTRAKRFLFGTWATRRIGPTARAGQGRVQERRSLSPFLEGGPVESEPGGRYLTTRWR